MSDCHYWIGIYSHDFASSAAKEKWVVAAQPLFKKLSESNEWFPHFGVIDCTSRGLYDAGPNDHFLPAIFSFTKHYPAMTFIIYFLHHNMSSLSVYTIRNTTVVAESHTTGHLKLSNHEVTVKFSPDFGEAGCLNNINSPAHIYRV